MAIDQKGGTPSSDRLALLFAANVKKPMPFFELLSTKGKVVLAAGALALTGATGFGMVRLAKAAEQFRHATTPAAVTAKAPAKPAAPTPPVFTQRS